MFHLKFQFASDVAIRGVLDQRRTEHRSLIWWITVHRIIIKALAQMGAVDRVSDIGRSRLNRALRIMGRHMAASGDSDEDQTSENLGDVGSWAT